MRLLEVLWRSPIRSPTPTESEQGRAVRAHVIDTGRRPSAMSSPPSTHSAGRAGIKGVWNLLAFEITRLRSGSWSRTAPWLSRVPTSQIVLDEPDRWTQKFDPCARKHLLVPASRCGGLARIPTAFRFLLARLTVLGARLPLHTCATSGTIFPIVESQAGPVRRETAERPRPVRPRILAAFHHFAQESVRSSR